ncbi:MAG: O-antigen ligase family protein [Roseivirga sp.]|nr:O-antigen ligase family protein [Roseivirga sp.]
MRLTLKRVYQASLISGLFLSGSLVVVGFLILKMMGITGALLLCALPLIIGVIRNIMKYPKAAVWLVLILSFLSPGLTRYVPGPWGLSIDILLAVCWLSILLNKRIKLKWRHARNPIVWVSLIWMAYLAFEMVNPAGNGPMAWFYAMRGIGFYQALAVPLIFLLFRKEADFQKFLNLLILLSLAGTIWGLKQQVFGVDAAEYRWLYLEDHHEEHILHGVLRVFSFYSDAGAFGASQAMMSLMCGILFTGPFSGKKKLFYLSCALIFLIGFAISGTRGALAVPLAGGIAYLIVIRNFNILIVGASTMIVVFCILKYTFLFQGVEQVRRMRTALDPNNKSLSVRLDNQKTFGRYLANKPFGGGVGTAGFWGARFNPESLMANTATDSWYVKIWAETGVVGLSLHLAILGFILGKGGKTCMLLQDPKRKTYACALFAAITGVIFASYGNQVFGQMPTGIIMNLAIPFLFLIPRWR